MTQDDLMWQMGALCSRIDRLIAALERLVRPAPAQTERLRAQPVYGVKVEPPAGGWASISGGEGPQSGNVQPRYGIAGRLPATQSTEQ